MVRCQGAGRSVAMLCKGWERLADIGLALALGWAGISITWVFLLLLFRALAWVGRGFTG